MDIPDATSPNRLSASKEFADLHDRKSDLELVEELEKLRAAMLKLEDRLTPLVERVLERHRESALNLIHYVSLRSNDIRQLQEQLVSRGLSSLGRCEGYVLANLEAVLSNLCANSAQWRPAVRRKRRPTDYAEGKSFLHRQSRSLFGGSSSDRTEVMVTMPTEAGRDYALVRDLLIAGMTVMRINCAHDHHEDWQRMIQHLRQAEGEIGTSCRVAMDIAGPKIRTGRIHAAVKVARWKPKRDPFGRIVSHPSVWIGQAHPAKGVHCDLAMIIQEAWWRSLKVGDHLRFIDSGGRRRNLKVVSVEDGGVVFEATRSAYVTPDTVFEHRVACSGERKRRSRNRYRLGDFALSEGQVRLFPGDRFQVTARVDESLLNQHKPDAIPVVECTFPSVFGDVAIGDPILLDDGKFAAVAREIGSEGLLLEVVRTREGGRILKSDKGMNFPNTEIRLPALTDKDKRDLDFIAKHADIVCFSFVHRPADVQMLHDELARLDRPDMAVILKIENQRALENLPRLLLEAMTFSSAPGVMIARGDLAVECGFERLAEVQEEILWMCESAHMPVIWATQVLEELAKNGVPTRAEITDAAMSARAECVMLNKGPNIVETVRMLHDILDRMQAHQVKKRSKMRRLRMVDQLIDSCQREA